MTKRLNYVKIYYVCRNLSLQPHRKGYIKVSILTLKASLIEGGKNVKAIFKTGGKQYLVTEGTELYVEKLDNEVNSEVVFNEVLYVDGEFGNPYVNGAKVTAEILKHGKQKKIIVFKYKPKKKYRKTQGHRQPYTKIVIKKIEKK